MRCQYGLVINDFKCFVRKNMHTLYLFNNGFCHPTLYKNRQCSPFTWVDNNDMIINQNTCNIIQYIMRISVSVFLICVSIHPISVLCLVSFCLDTNIQSIFMLHICEECVLRYLEALYKYKDAIEQ